MLIAIAWSVATPNAQAQSAPTISSFTPTCGPEGTSVTINGTELTGATSVQFNGTDAAIFTNDSSTQITATVPVEATTGKITVMTPNGTIVSQGDFTIQCLPTISGFSPSSGPVDTSVTINGTELAGATSVTFNGVEAVPTSNSSTQIIAPVPDGATTGKISVTTPDGTVTTSEDFTISVGPSGGLPGIWGFAAGGVLLVVGFLGLRRFGQYPRNRPGKVGEPDRPLDAGLSVRMNLEAPDVSVEVELGASASHCIRLVPHRDLGTQQLEEVGRS